MKMLSFCHRSLQKIHTWGIRPVKKPLKNQMFSLNSHVICLQDNGITYPSPTTTHLIACIMPDALKTRQNTQLLKTFFLSLLFRQRLGSSRKESWLFTKFIIWPGRGKEH